MRISESGSDQPMEYGGRINGKTFRRLTEALSQASAGNHVFYIVNDERMRHWVQDKLMGIVVGFFSNNGYTGANSQDGRRVVHFPGGGFVRLTTRHEWERNPVPSNVLQTHTIIEMDDTHEI